MDFYCDADEKAVSETMYKMILIVEDASQILNSLEKVDRRSLAFTLARCFEDQDFFRERFEEVASYLTPENFEFDDPSVRTAYGVALAKAIKSAMDTYMHWDRLKEICRQWKGNASFGVEITNDLELLAITPDEASFLLVTVPALVTDKSALLGILGKVADWYRAGTITTTVTKTSGHTRVVIALLSTLHSALTSAGNTKDEEVVSKAKQVYEDIKELIPSALKSGKKNDKVVLKRLFNEVETLLAN